MIDITSVCVYVCVSGLISSGIRFYPVKLCARYAHMNVRPCKKVVKVQNLK